MSSPTPAGTAPSLVEVTPEFVAAALKLATATVPTGSDGGLYRRLLCGLTSFSLNNHTVDAHASDGDHALDDLVVVGGLAREGFALDSFQNQADVFTDRLAVGCVSQQQGGDNLQSEKSSGDLVLKVVDDGVAHEVSPSNVEIGTTDNPLAERHTTYVRETGEEGSFGLPAHLHITLQRVASFSYKRGKRGYWQTEGMPDVPSDHVSQLTLRNMAKVFPGNRSPDRVEATEYGREVLASLRAARKVLAD